MSRNTRIAKNTLVLYFRQILILLTSLYTVRVVLNTLGAEDYGIYNVVAGAVTMFGFLGGSMSGASQRYFSFEIGRGDFERLKNVFSLTFLIYVVIAAVVLLAAETLGLWFVLTKLQLPETRKTAVIWVYETATVSFLFSLLTMPYMALVIARERMSVYAYVSIAEAFLRLAIVYVLRRAPGDKLILYGILTLAVTCVNTSMYRFVCVRKYAECKLRFYWDYKLFRELIAFTGWNLFGAFSSVVRDQGMGIVLNLYFGPLVNAAQAIARQVNAAVSQFAQNFSTAVKPQIVKLYARDKPQEMLVLVFSASKATCFLLFLFVLPLQLELRTVLDLWLKTTPEYCAVFVRLMLIAALIDAVIYPLAGAAQATGQIKVYQITVGFILLLNLPVSLVLLSLGFSAVAVPAAAAALSLCASVGRIVILSRQLGFSLRSYAKQVALPIVLSMLTGSAAPCVFVALCPAGITRLPFTVIISVISTGAAIFFAGLSGYEKRFVVSRVKQAWAKGGRG